MMPTFPVPLAGHLLLAPMGTELPVPYVRRGRFADDWPDGWIYVAEVEIVTYESSRTWVELTVRLDKIDTTKHLSKTLLPSARTPAERLRDGKRTSVSYAFGFESFTAEERVVARQVTGRAGRDPEIEHFNCVANGFAVYTAGTQ